MLRADDFDAYAAIFGHPEVSRYLGDGKPLDRVAAWRSLAWMLGHWQLRGYGQWAVEEQATGRLLGRIGLLNPEGWPGLEIGWVLARDAWGKGYATEGARRVLDYAFAEMGIDRLISLIYPDNAPSIRVAERLGERLQGRTVMFGSAILVYGIDRETWQRSLPAPPPAPPA